MTVIHECRVEERISAEALCAKLGSRHRETLSATKVDALITRHTAGDAQQFGISESSIRTVLEASHIFEAGCVGISRRELQAST